MYLKISLAVIAFLLYAAIIGFHSYAPYNILRLTVCLFSVYSACLWYKKSEFLTWGFAIMAIVMNPIVKIHLSRETWGIVDFVFICVIVVSMRLFQSIKMKK